MNRVNSSNMKIYIYIFISLLFLSANSILCRMALLSSNIDAFSFTFVRIFSAAFLLVCLYVIKYKKYTFKLKQNWFSSFVLFLYAITFSYSYTNMQAGIGTLILFAVVQLTMVFIAIFYKEVITLQKVIGIIIAFSGLFYLLYPNDQFSLSIFHLILMIISGIAWGIYTFIGRSSSNSFFDTTDNFFKASIFTLIFFFFFYYFIDIKIDFYNFILASISGTVTSALGYLLWYEVLPNIKIVTASVLQLLVPIFAIVLSIIFLQEELTQILIISTLIILLGILITLKNKQDISQST